MVAHYTLPNDLGTSTAYYDNYSGTEACAFTITSDYCTGVLYIPVRETCIEEPVPSPREEKLLRAYAASKRALHSARSVIRSNKAQPLSHPPYIRPISKKRVCAGSSRYRVLMN
jgi:hypothetical protein